MPRADATDAVLVDGLEISHGPGVLPPRPWTALQGRWAAELAADLPDGPILELHAGAGHIGLVAAARSGRPLVQVDADRRACRAARRNARRAGLDERVEIRHGDLAAAVRPGERFPLVLADPPYLPTAEVHRYPDDPRPAVDGGPDGLAAVRAVLEHLPRLLGPGGIALVQLRGPAQVAVARRTLPPTLRSGEARHWGRDRSVLLLRPESAAPPHG